MNLYRKLRKLRGLSQERAAQLVGVSVVTWRSWEGDKSSPSPLGREKLVAAFSEELDKINPFWYVVYKRNRATATPH